MIPPTVGRSLWYRAGTADTFPHKDNAPLHSNLCGVNDDGTINLAVFGFDGSGPYARQNVVLVQGGEPAPGQACWMPYQQGQAAKTEQLQQQLVQPNNEQPPPNPPGQQPEQAPAETPAQE